MLPPAARDRLIPADDVRRMTKFACLLGQCLGWAAMQEAWGSKGEGTEILISMTANDYGHRPLNMSFAYLCFHSLGTHGPEPSLFFKMGTD